MEKASRLLLAGLQRLEIREVLCPADGPLVPDEVATTEDGDAARAHRVGLPVPPRLLEVEAAHLRHEIDPTWGKPDLHDHSRRLQVRPREADVAHRSAEAQQGIPDA